MKKFILSTLVVLAFSSESLAQKIKVRRVKGNQAIVEFTGGNLEAGRVYELTADDFNSTSTGGSARQYVAAVSMSLKNTKSDATGAQNETDITMAGQFGWNLGSYEVGPLGVFASSAGGYTTSSYKLGGFLDYNMIANAPGEVFLYGIGGTLTVGQSDNGLGVKSDLMGFTVGPFAKWFPTNNDIGVRIDLGFIYEKSSGGSSDVTVSGVNSSLGLITYF